MREAIISFLKMCANCGKLTHNRDGYCDSCPTESSEENDEDTDTTTRD